VSYRIDEADRVTLPGSARTQFSDDVSEDAREPYNGCVTFDGDLLRVRFGPVPRSSPDAGDLAAGLEPIPISDILIDE
jgi:hypothetical protein